MKPFNKPRKFEKREFDRPKKREFSGRSDRSEREFDRRDSGRSSGNETGAGFQLHHATCDKCGIECDVPFKPTGNKPIYCRSCFRAGAGETSSRGNNFDRGRSESKDRYEPKTTSNITADDIEKINKKLDKIMKALKI